jgi:hypothetical protein
MTRPFDGRDGPPGTIPQHGFLTPTIRRDVADLNHRFLSLALEPALSGDDRFALPEEVHHTLEAGDESLLMRVAACPFTLFQVSLADRRLGGPGPGVEDNRRPVVDAATASRAQEFAHVAVFLAWRLADDEPMAFRVVLGLSAGDELLLNQTRSSDLPRLAGGPQFIRPRWIRHPRYWRLLVRAAAAAGDATLQRVHCAGICMVVADLWGQDGQPMDRSGPGRR